MTYLFKLANRISRLRTALPLFLAAAACSRGGKVDFLGPNPGAGTPQLQSIRVSPSITSAQVGSTIRFTASGYSATGATMPVAVYWIAQGGSITPDGQYTGETAGLFTVVARARENATVADSALVGVWSAAIDQVAIIVSPDSALIEEGDSLDLTAAVALSNGWVARDAVVAWSSDGGAMTSAGRLTVNLSGIYTVTATAPSGLRGQAKVFVRVKSRSLQGIALNPKTATRPRGATIAYSATGQFSDGSSAPTTVQWSATGGTISSAGLYTAAGRGGIYAVIGHNAYGTVVDTATVAILQPTVVGLSISPNVVLLGPAATVNFVAQARLSDGSFTNVTVNWQATGGTINSVGLYTAGNTAGGYRAIVTSPEVAGADTATITIVQPVATLTGILLNPGSVSLGAGQTRQFEVTGVWSDGSNATPPVAWSGTGGTISASGLYTAGSAPGTYRVIASTASGVADTSQVTVLPAVLTSLVVTPRTASVVSGQTLQFSVTGTWSDGSTSAPAVTWNATGGTITSGGLYAAGGSAGTYVVIAAQQGGGRADTSFVTVSLVAPVLTAIVLSPASVALGQGAVQQFSTYGIWSDGGTTSPAISWSATGGTVNKSGRYTAGQTAGTYRIIARQSGGTRADTSAVVIMAPPAVTSLTIAPKNTSSQVGSATQFAASALWSNGSTTLPPLTWTATGGIITSGGRYTAGATVGTFRVIAAGGGKADTAVITLTAAVVTSFIMSPKSVSVAPGATQQFQASATWSDGVARAVSVSYGATGGTVTMGGLFTAGAVLGTFAVTANCSCGKADTALAFVTQSVPATLTSLEMNPAAVDLLPGGTQQFSLSYAWSNGSTSAPLVSYSASAGSVSSTGLYTAPMSPGTFQVIVSHSGGTLKGTSVVTVAAALPPPQGGNNMFFNSSEPGCGTDPTVLMCDDFEDGDWYTKDYDQAMSSGGLLQTDGWGGTIYANPTTPAGAAVCGNAGYRSNCAATSGFLDGSIGGRNMADHGFAGNVSLTDVSWRLYFQPQTDYRGGHEKMFDFVRGVGTGQMVALCFNYFGTGTIQCIPYLHQDDGVQGQADGWMGSNAGPTLSIQRGRWYFIELHVRLNTPGSYDGLFEWWLNDCGPTGTACTGTPTLRGRYTNVKYRNAGAEASIALGGIWIENWANAASNGTMYYDQLKVSTTGPIGFMP